MFDLLVTRFERLIQAIPLSGTSWLVIGTVLFFVWIFSRAHKNPNSPIQWEHLVMDTSVNRASPYKLGFLIGLVVSTWIVVSLSDKNLLTYDIFGMYLTYLLGGAGWNSFVKRNSSNNVYDTEQLPNTPSDIQR